MTKKYDYLIIGQGIAGSAFAWNLHFKNKSFLILDSKEKNSASEAALGIYNPITGRRNSLTWNADKLFNTIESFYSKVEKIIEKKIIYKKNIFRPFKNNSDINNWTVRSENSKFKNYIKKLDEKGVLTSKSGHLNVSKYLIETRKYFKSLDRYIEKKITSKNIILNKNKIIINGFKAKNIIMTLGINQNKLDLFSYLPLRPVSGNSIFVEADFKSKNIINDRISVINTSKNNLHAGSTYYNGFENMGTDKIENHLKKIIKKDFRIKQFKFGVRPATKDRRPFVGRHYEFNNLFILNGLGSKGVSQSPYCSKELLNYIEFNKNLDREINIERIKNVGE